MPIGITKDDRDAAIASIRRFSEESLEEPLGTLAAGLLLDFFLEELAPIAYNKAVRDVQNRLQSQILELDLDVSEVEFGYSKTRGWSS